VLPQAIPPAAMSETPVVALAANAPQKMAGQYCGPRRRSAASATPVGGQTGEIDPPMTAYCSHMDATEM
jgi:hypothetical protein